jgi:hypothetical protein
MTVAALGGCSVAHAGSKYSIAPTAAYVEQPSATTGPRTRWNQ